MAAEQDGYRPCISCRTELGFKHMMPNEFVNAAADFSWTFQVWREEAQAQEETEARREHCRWRSEVDEPIVGYGHVRGGDRQLGLIKCNDEWSPLPAAALLGSPRV